jgi:hypothetical protein
VHSEFTPPTFKFYHDESCPRCEKQQKDCRKSWSSPPIPSEKVERPAPTKAERTEFKLFTNPNEPKSQTYNIKIRHFKTGPPEHWLETMDDLERVIQGSRVTTAEATFALARTILEGEALSYAFSTMV